MHSRKEHSRGQPKLGHGHEQRSSGALNLSPFDHGRFKGAFPYFRKPQIVGSFSLDAQRTYLDDRSQLKYLPNYGDRSRVSLDLNEGMDNVLRKEETNKEKLSHLLKWILNHRDQFSVDKNKPLESLHTDFVCYRGLLTTLACMPFEQRDGMRMRAIKWKNTIYLHKEETPDQEQQRLNSSERQKVMCSWGYKFEDYVLSDDPSDVSLTGSDRVIEPEEFCCAFRTRIGDFSLVYGAEMDGMEVNKNTCRDKHTADLSQEQFVELKTSRHIEHAGQQRNFTRFKLLKWWSQCFFAGIPRVLCGFRDDDGLVHTLTSYNVKDMPSMGRQYWQSNVCINFLCAMLQFTKAQMDSVAEGVVLEFTFDPKGYTRVVKVTEATLSEEERELYLPRWYFEHIFKHD